MSRFAVGVANNEQRFPRVSGDEPGGELYPDADLTFSPRERG